MVDRWFATAVSSRADGPLIFYGDHIAEVTALRANNERLVETTERALDEIKALVVAAFADKRLAKSNLNAAAHKIEALRSALAAAKH